jgi:hypothetical protein
VSCELAASYIGFDFRRSYHIRPLHASLITLHDDTKYPKSRVRVPVETRFSAHVQTDPGAYPATCTMGTGSFPGIKRPGRGVDPPSTSIPEVKERVELPLLPNLGLHGLF